MAHTDFADYVATYDPDEETFREMLDLAEKVGGTLGLTREGRLVITLTESNAVEVAARLTAKDFTYGFVVPGTDSHLVFEF